MRQRMARLGMAPLGVAWHGVAGFGPGWAGQYVPILPRSSLSMTAARLHHSGEWPMEAGALGLGHGPEVVVCPSEGARVLPPGSHPGLHARPDPVTTCSLRERSNSSVLAGFESLRLGRVVTGRVDPRHRMMPA